MSETAQKQLEKLRSVIDPICRAHGVALVDARMTTEHGAVLRVLIERPSESAAGAADASDTQSGVSLADCQNVSRDLSTALDVAEGVAPAGRYRLEVSSPGIERPLITSQDCTRFAGREVRVQSIRPIGGRRRFQGVLQGLAAERMPETVRVQQDGETFEIPLADITKANLVYRFDSGQEKGRRRSTEQGRQR
jgi:ribosome maturation factor RimP